jgi:chorismate mutase
MERCLTTGYTRRVDYILNLLVIRKETQTTENLAALRRQIDECDNS